MGDDTLFEISHKADKAILLSSSTSCRADGPASLYWTPLWVLHWHCYIQYGYPLTCGLFAEDILENDFLPCWLYVRTHGKCKTSGLQIIKLSSFLLSPDHNIQHQTLVGRTLTKFGLAESSLHLSLQPRPGLDPPHSLHQLGNGRKKDENCTNSLQLTDIPVQSLLDLTCGDCYYKRRCNIKKF